MRSEHRVNRLGHKGDGVAPGPVFVPRALPGEVVEGVVDGSRLIDARIVLPSERRVSPLCPHYRRCGGCALQHADTAFVSSWKASVIEQALAARGITIRVRQIHTSAPGTRRRAVLTGRRTKSGAIVGFHAPESHTIYPIPHCRLLSPPLMRSLPALEALTGLAASRKSDVRFSVTDTDDGVDVLVLGGKDLTLPLQQDIAQLAEAHDFARVAWGDEIVVTRRPPCVSFGGSTVRLPPGAFLQATPEGETALQTGVRQALGGVTGTVVDLFSGAGTFALDLAKDWPVHAVESDGALLGALQYGWRHGTGLKQVTTEGRDLFRRPLTADELSSFGAVVIDPPRAGAERQMIEIARSGITTVASVSCDPVTFARDAALLVDAGFEIGWLDVVDQFRWSPHIETVAQFFR